MSDMYGTEPTDHDSGHDEVLTPEHEIVHEPPSDYEFADDHGGAAATEDNEHNDEQHILSGDETPARRSAVLPIAAAIGGIILLGGVAWWQFGGSSSAPPPPPAMIATNISPGSASPPTSSSTESPAPLAVVPMSTVAPRTSSATTQAPTVATPATPASTAAMPVLSSQQPALPLATSEQQRPVAVQAASSASIPTTTSPLASAIMGSGSQDQHIVELDTRMDGLQKSLEQTSQQVNQVASMVAASVTNLSASVAASRDLQQRLDKVEQEITQLRHPAPILAAPSSLPADNAVTPSLPKTIVTRHHTHAAHIVASSDGVVSHHVAHHHHVMATSPVSTGWVLRAASPGQAWVGVSATSHDLKQLHVGDELTGIGRVTAIQQQDGNWTVQGTKGSVQ
jgi:hypothetical protein